MANRNAAALIQHLKTKKLIMPTLRITNGFERLSDANLEARTNQIIADLTANFATAPSLPDLVAARDAFTAALAASLEGSLIDKAIKNQCRQQLVYQHHVMIPYILGAAAGDRVTVVKSGYTPGKDPAPAPEVTAAQGQTLENGLNSGELQLRFGRVPGAKSYMYQSTPDPLTDASVWSTDTGTVSRFLFKGLQAGKRYWVRVVAVGINGQKVYSQPVLSKLVQ